MSALLCVAGFVTPLRSRNKIQDPLTGEDLELLETTLEGLVPHLAQMIRDGFYPVQVDKDVAHLDPSFQSICRFAEVESYRESLSKHVDLLQYSETVQKTSEEST